MVQIHYKSAPQPSDLTPALIEAAQGSPVLATLLWQRGVRTPEAIKQFIQLDDYEPTSCTAFNAHEDAYDKARERIFQAIDSQEMILVFGDFDVDGITGTTILTQGLKTLGAKVSYYVPKRHTEGHGLNTAALMRLVSSRQVKLVITTDTGITNFNEVQLLTGFNVDTIITDHHDLPEHLPKALSILNPKLLEPDSPLYHLCGAGVAFKLMEALYAETRQPPSAINALLDCTALGTVVDMVPLLGDNRYLVWKGMQQLQRRERLGLRTLLEHAEFDEDALINETTMGFTIGPRLNAIGRLGDAAEAVELMLTDDPEEAKHLAGKLEQLNRRRRELVEECVIQAEQYLMRTGELSDKKAIIIASPEWNQGVVGLMATRLVEKYRCPCFIGTVDEEAQEIKFSARSIESFHLSDNLKTLEDLFGRWGGHAGAAGFSVPSNKLAQLKQRLWDLCDRVISDEDRAPWVWVDADLQAAQITPNLLDIIDVMAPFGMENPLPVFALPQVPLGEVKRIGEDKRHLQVIVKGQAPAPQRAPIYLKGLWWQFDSTGFSDPASGEITDLVFTLQRNEYKGTVTAQLILKALSCLNRSVIPAIKPSLEEVSRRSGATPPLQPKPYAKKPEASSAESVEMPSPEPVSLVSDVQAEAETWLDHRFHDAQSWQSLFQQVLSAPDDYVIFSEGSQSGLAFPALEAKTVGRVLPGETVVINPDMPPQLIIWDIPAEDDVLLGLIAAYQPSHVHWLGGKYQTLPLFRPAPIYLEGLRQSLVKLARQQASMDTPLALMPQVLAQRLSTSTTVINSALVVLERLKVCQINVNNASGQLSITLLPTNQPIQMGDSPESTAWVQSMEYHVFQSALKTVQQYRQWLMQAPLSVIRSSLCVVSAESLSGTKESKEPVHASVVR